MSHHNPPSSKRDYYTHHILKTLHIITYSLYIFYCIYFWLYFHNAYIYYDISPQRNLFFLRFKKFLQVFNPHFLMVALLTTCNIFQTCNITHTLFYSMISFHPVCVWSSFQRDKTASHFLHSSPSDLLYVVRVNFCSFVARSN